MNEEERWKTRSRRGEIDKKRGGRGGEGEERWMRRRDGRGREGEERRLRRRNGQLDEEVEREKEKSGG